MEKAPYEDAAPLRSSARTDVLAFVLLAAALSLGLTTRLYNLSSPFGIGFDGWLGSFYSQAGRNFDRVGFIALRFAPHCESGPVKYGEVPPYLRRPPLLALATGLAFRTFGESERSARLFPAACYLLSLVLFFLAVRKATSPRVAGGAALALAAFPMTGIYGGLVVVEPVWVAAVLANWLAYLRFRETGRGSDLALAAAVCAATALVDWFTAFGGIAITAHATLVKPRAPARCVPLLALAWLAGAALVLAHAAWAGPGSLADLVRVALERSSTRRMEMPQTDFTWGEWAARQALYYGHYYRTAGLALAAASPLLAWLSKREDLRRGAIHAGALGLVGLLSVACFPAASFEQDYWSYPLSLAFAFGIALAVAGALALAAASRAEWLRLALRGATVAALVAFAIPAQRATWFDLVRFHDDHAYRDVADELALMTEFEAGIVTPDGDTDLWMPVTYYADRAVYLAVGSLDRIEELRSQPPRPSAPPRYVAFAQQPPSPVTAELASELASRYPCSRGAQIVLCDLGPPGD